MCTFGAQVSKEGARLRAPGVYEQRCALHFQRARCVRTDRGCGHLRRRRDQGDLRVNHKVGIKNT